MKILIVDDSSTMRMIIKRTMKQAGFTDVEVSEASDGKEGLAAVDDFEPNVVLSDWNMPNMTGIEFLKSLREKGNDVSFGFITTESTTEMRDQAREAGAQFYITKPFTADKFEAEIRKVIG